MVPCKSFGFSDFRTRADRTKNGWGPGRPEFVANQRPLMINTEPSSGFAKKAPTSIECVRTGLKGKGFPEETI